MQPGPSAAPPRRRLAVVAAGGCGGTASPAAVVPSTGFGGYRWWGPVRQTSARWQVPLIVSRFRTVLASTWIGVQNVDGGYPFIQLGVLEDDVGGFRFYEGFWSDTAQSFHPRQLDAVEPGDVVAADMERTSGGWRLRLDDLSDGDDMSLHVDYASNGLYDQAEWLQEDPTSSIVTLVDLSWPAGARPALRRLAVANERVVAAYRFWLATGAGTGSAAFSAVHMALLGANADAARTALGLPPA